MLAAVLSLALAVTVPDEAPPEAPSAVVEEAAAPSRAHDLAWFLGGGLAGLGLHEGSHLAFDTLFDAQPTVRRVSFAGIPFFAISPTAPLTPRERYLVTAAGFASQYATSEWFLTTRPNLRDEHAPFLKGMLAFDILLSAGYAGTAFTKAGPAERDTRGLAETLRLDEAWVGGLLLVPAALDAWRYFDPDAPGWVRWASRAAKVALVVLAVRPESGPRR